MNQGRQAVSATRREGVVTVAGTDIAWSSEGHGDPPLLLLHGGGAHAGWWDPVRVAFGGRRGLITLDLSGHGASGRRERYSVELWGRELVAVIEAASAGSPVVLVAHSMGGRPAAVAAARRPDLISALVLIDSVLPPRADVPVPGTEARREYGSLEEAVLAFRLMPPQPPVAPETTAMVARRALIEVEGRWRWRVDPRVFAAGGDATVIAALRQIRCPVLAIRGELSTVTRFEDVGLLSAALGREVPLSTVPGTHHHLPLEAPAELAELLEGVPG